MDEFDKIKRINDIFDLFSEVGLSLSLFSPENRITGRDLFLRVALFEGPLSQEGVTMTPAQPLQESIFMSYERPIVESPRYLTNLSRSADGYQMASVHDRGKKVKFALEDKKTLALNEGWKEVAVGGVHYGDKFRKVMPLNLIETYIAEQAQRGAQ